MTKILKDILAGYLDLFGQPPVDIGSDFNSNGLMADMDHLANDWRQVGFYLNNAMIEWEQNQGIQREHGQNQKK